MTIDTKKMIVEAAKKLMFEKGVRKLTVKDIVTECQITRQTFYYHFEDIPALIQWEMERELPKIIEEARLRGNAEEGLKHFFLLAINVSPYIKKGMKTNYREELEQLQKQFVYRLFAGILETEKLYQNINRFEMEILLRYHTSAILGILGGWTEEDTQNLDSIVHEIYRIMSGGTSQYYKHTV